VDGKGEGGKCGGDGKGVGGGAKWLALEGGSGRGGGAGGGGVGEYG